MSALAKHTARFVGLVAGAGIAFALLLAGRVPASTGELPAALTLDLGRSGELVVSPRGPLLTARELTPGGRRSTGRASLSNPTRVPLSVRPRVARGSRHLDGLVWVRMRIDGERAYDGTLGGLRQQGAAPFEIAPRARRRITLTAWLAPGATGHEARRTRAALELITTVGAR